MLIRPESMRTTRTRRETRICASTRVDYALFSDISNIGQTEPPLQLVASRSDTACEADFSGVGLAIKQRFVGGKRTCQRYSLSLAFCSSEPLQYQFFRNS